MTYYGDTLDTGSEIPATEAWRYRDYVIRAFNGDKPVNQFFQEQIAGDLLPAKDQRERNEFIVATGYLAIGPWAIVLADKPQLQMDTIDQQLELIGRGMLGLTLGCSRCHDHKFDPITLQDYYGMAGILKSTRTLHGRLSEGTASGPISEIQAGRRLQRCQQSQPGGDGRGTPAAREETSALRTGDCGTPKGLGAPERICRIAERSRSQE